MGKEIEKRFLLKKGCSVPIPKNFKYTKIHQGYLLGKKDRQVRVRLAFDELSKQSFMCVKFTEGPVRDEFEYEIPFKDGQSIYKKCKWSLEKLRCSFKKDGYHYDMDSYPNKDRNGASELVTVEVEFKSIKDMEKWKKPNWLGEEISGLKKYSNIILAKKNLKFQ